MSIEGDKRDQRSGPVFRRQAERQIDARAEMLDLVDVRAFENGMHIVRIKEGPASDEHAARVKKLIADMRGLGEVVFSLGGTNIRTKEIAAALLELHAKTPHAALGVCDLNEKRKQDLKLLGLHRIVGIFDSAPEAIKARVPIEKSKESPLLVSSFYERLETRVAERLVAEKAAQLAEGWNSQSKAHMPPGFRGARDEQKFEGPAIKLIHPGKVCIYQATAAAYEEMTPASERFVLDLGKAVGGEGVHLILNLRGVHALGADAVGGLISSLKEAEKRGGSLSLCGVEPRLYELLKRYNLIPDLLRVYGSQEEALRKVGGAM